MKLKYVKFEKQEKIFIITINRPKALNALNDQVIEEIKEIMTIVENDNDIKVLIITGSGKAFVAGADIASMIDKDYEGGKLTSKRGSGLFRKIETLPIPVIAAINGFALGGGCELALACDIRIASENAKFGQPEVKLGITPGYGGTQRLPRLIGTGLAKELIYTGDMIGAKQAEKIGLVNHVYKHENLIKETIKLAKKIAYQAPIAVKNAKFAINKGIETDIDSGLEIENESFSKCFSTKDQKEGMGAFLDKRKPNFIGK